jgi:hypothetical protein
MSRHCFNFEGGDQLTTMGATWFVSYAYYTYINRTHTNWQKVSTHRGRASVFQGSKRYHSYWLSKIGKMSDNNLEKNTLGLRGFKVKQMAKEILTKI